MGYQVTDWRHGDSENVMLGKLLQKFGGMPLPGDSSPSLLRKILNIASIAENFSSFTNFKDGPGNVDARVYNTNGTLEVARFSGGSFSVLAGTISASGNITTTTGNFVANAGDLTLSSGKITITSPSLIASAPGITVNQTWNNGVAPIFVGMDINITDTASPSGNSALLIRGVVNAVDVFRVRKDGTIFGTRFTGLGTSATSHTVSDSGTSSTPNLLVLGHDSSGTPVVGFGGTLEFQAKSDTTASRIQGRIIPSWTAVADASRTSRIDFYSVTNGTPVRGLSIATAQTQVPDGSSGTPALTFINETTLGLYRSGSGVMNFVGGYVDVAGRVQAYNYVITTSALTYGANVAVDFLGDGVKTCALTGDVSITTTNGAAGRGVVIKLLCDGTPRNLTFHASWKFLGTKPATIAANKTAILLLRSFGAGEADVVAEYSVEP